MSMEDIVKSKQFDVCKTMSTIHSLQSSTFVQPLIQVKMKLLWVGINLSAINNSLFWKWGYLTIGFCSEMEVQRLLIYNRNSTTKSNYLNMTKWADGNLQKFGKDFDISYNQKCDELHKSYKANISLDKFTANFENCFPNTTFIQ